MEEEEGTEAVFREGMNVVLKEQVASKNNVSNEGHLYPKEENKLQEKDPPTNVIDKGKGGIFESSSKQGNHQRIYKACSPIMARYQEQKAQRSHVTTDDIDDNDNEIVKEIDNENIENYHPSLKGAIYAEGQEAVWHEDEYTTVSSVYVQPEKKKNKDDATTSPSIIPSHCSQQEQQQKQPPRNRINIPFFLYRGRKHHQNQKQHNQQKSQQHTVEKEQQNPLSVKIHIKKKKISKAVLLLPPNQVQVVGSTAITDRDEKIEEKPIPVKENETHAAITANTIQARRLLDTVLSGDIVDEIESERTTKAAFTHAATARRLAYRSYQEIAEGKPVVENKDNADDNDKDDDDDNDNEEVEELEHVMSYLAEEGEQAVLNHMKHIMQDAEKDDEGMVASSMKYDIPNNEEKKRGGGKFAVSGYATRAVHYLESIIPKSIGHGTNGEKIKEDAQLRFAFSSGDDFWSDSGISTLGLKNDTLEYGFSIGTDDVKNHLALDGVEVLHNIDLMSLSSLNEILDGNVTIDNDCINIKKQQQQKEEVLRKIIPEISIPNKQKNAGLRPSTKAKRSRGILGRMTPSSMHTNQKDQATTTSTTEKKKWGGFFKTPRASEGIPSKLLLVIEEPEQEDASSSSSDSGSASDTVAISTIDDNQRMIDSITHSGNDVVSMAGEALVEAESDSTFGIKNSNWYAPSVVPEKQKERGNSNRYRSIPKENEIELKLSVTTTSEIQDCDEKKDNDQYPEKNEPSSSSSLEIIENVDRIDCVERKNSSTSSNSNGNHSIDRYKTQPLGTISGNDNLELDEEENRGNHIEEEEKRGAKKSQVVSKATGVTELNNKKQAIDVNNNESERTQVEKETQQSMETSNIDTVRNDKGRVNAQGNEIKRQKVVSQLEGNFEVQKDSPEEVMSTSASEGSKSKIFGRIIDMIGQNKRRALVPNSIIEETYVVDDKHSKSAVVNNIPLRKLTKQNAHPKMVIPGKSTDTNEEERKCIHNVSNKTSQITDLRKPTRQNLNADKLTSEKNIQSQTVRKPTVCQRAKEISRMKKQSKASERTTINESTVVVEKAIAHGNLKAVESNLDEGDVPLNYLAIMLKKKLKEEKTSGRKSSESIIVKEDQQQQRQVSKPDADSFVAEIRGPRLQEAPGVVLEEIAIRNYSSNRDPTIGNSDNKIRTDLAPTPRHSDNVAASIDEEDDTKQHNRDPPIQDEVDERQRRKVITERLFQAGNSRSENETNSKKNSTEIIETVPTVESAASYEEEEPLKNFNNDATGTTKEIDNVKERDRTSPQLHVESNHTRRKISISFLKGGRRRK